MHEKNQKGYPNQHVPCKRTRRLKVYRIDGGGKLPYSSSQQAALILALSVRSKFRQENNRRRQMIEPVILRQAKIKILGTGVKRAFSRI